MKTITTLEQQNMHLWSSLVILFIFSMIIITALIYGGGRNSINGLKEQLNECKEKIPNQLELRYNFTRCVFQTLDDEIVVCNLLMKESCSDITFLDENCEVVQE